MACISCRRGGIGRRSRLKICRPQGCGSSSLPAGSFFHLGEPRARRGVRLCGGSVRDGAFRTLPDRPAGAPPIRHAKTGCLHQIRFFQPEIRRSVSPLPGVPTRDSAVLFGTGIWLFPCMSPKVVGRNPNSGNHRTNSMSSGKCSRAESRIFLCQPFGKPVNKS